MIYFVAFLTIGLLALFFYSVCHVAWRKPGPLLITSSLVNLLFAFVFSLMGEAVGFSGDGGGISKQVRIYSFMVDLLYSAALVGIGVGLLRRLLYRVYRNNDVKPG